MKYIRTAVDVEIVVREFEKDLYVRTKDEKYYPNHRLDKKFVLKQSDTIKELLDEFVCENKIIKGVVEKRTKDGKIKKAKTNIEVAKILAKKHKVYGAIWTYKGLIYVAKMNEKGELELL